MIRSHSNGTVRGVTVGAGGRVVMEIRGRWDAAEIEQLRAEANAAGLELEEVRP